MIIKRRLARARGHGHSSLLALEAVARVLPQESGDRLLGSFLRRFLRHSGAVKPKRSNHEQTRLDAAQTLRYTRLRIPLDSVDSGSLVLECCLPLVLVPEKPGRPASPPSALEELRRRRDFERQAAARGVAAIESLLQDPDSPTEQIRSHLLAVNTKYEEMKVVDKRVKEIIDLDELEAEFFTSFEYDERVTLILSPVSFARPSAVPSLVAAQSTGALSPDFTIIWHGETAVLPGDSKRAVDVDNVANVHSACGPRVCDLDVRTVSEDSHRLEKLAELATDSL